MPEFGKVFYRDVIVCDDHAICRIGMEMLLQNGTLAGFVRVRKAASAQETLRLAAEAPPELFVLDLGLPDMNGAELVRALRSSGHSAVIVVMTSSENPLLLRQALEAGAQGVLLKTHSLEEIQSALEQISRGEIFITPRVQELLSNSEEAQPTPREHEVLALLAKGHTTKEIAGILGCSAETVKSHRSHLLRKMKARNTAELTFWYLERYPKTGPGAFAGI